MMTVRNEIKAQIVRAGYTMPVSYTHLDVYKRQTHWLPNIIKEFQKAYPGIDYELLLGDYTEIEEWISEGRVDCGFLRLPTCSDFETVFLEQDRLLAVSYTHLVIKNWYF